MTPAARKELHDRTLDRLFDAIRGTLDEEHVLLRGVRWAPHSDFPKDEYLFDLVIVHGSPCVVADGGITRLAICSPVVTVIDVLDDDTEPEFYDKPDTLLFGSTCEYVVWDPSAELMRPNLSAARKRDGSFLKVRSTAAGVFFSSTGFRLDVHGTDFTVSKCGRLWDEEELLRCRLAHTKHPTPQLAEKIARLEQKVREPRRRLDE